MVKEAIMQRTNMRSMKDMEQEIICLRDNVKRLQKIVARRNEFVKKVIALGDEELQSLVHEMQYEEDIDGLYDRR